MGWAVHRELPGCGHWSPLCCAPIGKAVRSPKNFGWGCWRQGLGMESLEGEGALLSPSIFYILYNLLLYDFCISLHAIRSLYAASLYPYSYLCSYLPLYAACCLYRFSIPYMQLSISCLCIYAASTGICLHSHIYGLCSLIGFYAYIWENHDYRYIGFHMNYLSYDYFAFGLPFFLYVKGWLQVLWLFLSKEWSTVIGL